MEESLKTVLLGVATPITSTLSHDMRITSSELQSFPSKHNFQSELFSSIGCFAPLYLLYILLDGIYFNVAQKN